MFLPEEWGATEAYKRKSQKNEGPKEKNTAMDVDQSEHLPHLRQRSSRRWPCRVMCPRRVTVPFGCARTELERERERERKVRGMACPKRDFSRASAFARNPAVGHVSSLRPCRAPRGLSAVSRRCLTRERRAVAETKMAVLDQRVDGRSADVAHLRATRRTSHFVACGSLCLSNAHTVRTKTLSQRLHVWRERERERERRRRSSLCVCCSRGP